MERFISDVHSQCCTSFMELITAIQHPAQGVRDFQRQTPVKDISEEFDKYILWAGNVGAAHSGELSKISLDYRLREASFYKIQVLKLLDTLDSTVQRAVSITQGKRKPFEDLMSLNAASTAHITESEESNRSDEADSDESPWEISSSSDNGEQYNSKDASKITDKSRSSTSQQTGLDFQLQSSTQEMPQLLESIKFTIACLYKMPIRQPARLDRLKNKAASEASCYQPFDVLYVKDKFPQLDSKIATRLGKMISLRRQLMFYRRSHNEGLKTSIAKPKVTMEPLLSKNTSLPERTEMQSEPTPDEVLSEKTGSQATPSRYTIQTKATTFVPHAEISSSLYPPSLAESKSSMASSYTGRNLRVEVPPRPKGKEGNTLDHFECPFCLVAIVIRSEHAWKKHVLKDLQPYVCTYPDCDLLDFFKDRNEWHKHETQRHRMEWFCNIDGHPQYAKQSDFLAHMNLNHGATFNASQLPMLLNMFQRPSRTMKGTCNLCFSSSVMLKSHISHHLQQIALFAIPRTNEVGDDETAILNENISKQSPDVAIDGDREKDKSQGSGSSKSTSQSEQSQIMGEDEITAEGLEIGDHVDQVIIPDADDPDWDMVTTKFSAARDAIALESTMQNISVAQGTPIQPPYTPKEYSSYGQLSERLVIGIDYGTKYTAVAFCHSSPRRPTIRDIHLVMDWPGRYRNASDEKVPSEVAYFDNGFQWGNRIDSHRKREAWTKLLLMVEAGDVKDTEVKEKLRKIGHMGDLFRENLEQKLGKAVEVEGVGSEKEIQAGINKDLVNEGVDAVQTIKAHDIDPASELIRGPVEIITDFLSGVRIHLESVLEGRYGKMLKLLEREVVITVPVVSSEKTRNLMYKAFCNAGFNAKGTKISMITETEAVAIYILRDLKEGPFSNIQAGDHFVVCDAGGGNVDTVTYRVESVTPIFTIKEVSIGANCGAVFVDYEFISWLKHKLGNERFEKIPRKHFNSGSRLMNDFEIAKISFAGDDQISYVRMPPEIGPADDPAIDMVDQEIRIHPEEMRSIFKPCIDQILSLIVAHIQEAVQWNAKIKYILLAGGFGKSGYLFQSMKEHCVGREIEVIRPSNSWSTVVRGAVLEKLDPVSSSLIQLRLCRRHYGVSLLEPFDEGKHVERDKFLDHNRGIFFARGCMKWLIAKGDPVQSFKPKKSSFETSVVSKNGRPQVSIVKVFAWDNDNPPHREPSGSYEVCVLNIDLKNVNPEQFISRKGAGGRLFQLVECQIEISIESSMLEFRVLVDGRECCKERQKYV